MKIDISSRLVILAAGRQSRFGPGRPKCMSEINGETMLARLVHQFDMDTVIVTPTWWQNADIQAAKLLGETITVQPDLTLGHSIAAGLACCNTHVALVISADTVIPVGGMRIPRGVNWALFDPWEWITLQIFRCDIHTRQHCEKHCGNDRVAYMTSLHMPVDLFHEEGWINVNTHLDLERAREVCK